VTSVATRPRPGGTTSPTKHELIRFARLVLGNAGIKFSQNQIVRLVLRFQHRFPGGSGWMFFLLLVNKFGMSEQQQREARLSPDIARILGHFDPTAADAIRKVMATRGF
jgi:hypothetical protein